MLQITLHKKIHKLYSVYPELVNDNRLLEFIMLTSYDDLDYILKHRYDELRWLLSDARISLNDYRDAPSLESITRAARFVRAYMGIEPNSKRKRREDEMRDAYSTQARLEL